MAVNAREAMPQGGRLKIAFATCHVADRQGLIDGFYLRISISDTGIGMAPDVVQRAFDPFFSTKPTGLASGLGLSMVYGMSRQSGGTTIVESEEAVGTTVTVYLQLADADAPISDEIEEDVDPTTIADLKGLHILLVDDETPTRTVVAMTLESLGCRVSQAESGAEAIARMDELRPDLFVLDFAMPGMTGAEAATTIRDRRPGSRFVFLTGFADSGAIEAAAGKEAIVLHKPASMRQLALAMIRALGHSPDRTPAATAEQRA
jgi:CheY-like chemotaxis protein